LGIFAGFLFGPPVEKRAVNNDYVPPLTAGRVEFPGPRAVPVRISLAAPGI